MYLNPSVCSEKLKLEKKKKSARITPVLFPSVDNREDFTLKFIVYCFFLL